MAEETQRPSTMEDYYNVVNPLGIQYNNPKTRFNIENDFVGKLDTKDPMFKSAYDQADIETKREMYKATSVSHALKIFERRNIQQDSAKAVNQDPLLVQFAMGAIPALTDPTTAIPVAGAAAKALGVAKATTRLGKAAKVGAVGAIAGGVSNVASEAVFDNQGLEVDYLSAGLFGMAFGGTLGSISGALSGPKASGLVRGMDKEHDTYSKDYDTDPNIVTAKDDNGNVQILGVQTRDGEVLSATGADGIAQMDTNIIDKIPLLGNLLKSDVTKVYQSPSQILRDYMSKISSATTSLKDARGNVIPIKETGVDYLKRADGVHGNQVFEVDEAYASARQDGYLGSREDFVDEISDVYVKASRDQEFAAYRSDMDNQKYYDTHEVEFKANNPHVLKGAEAYRKYYNTMLENGQKLGVEELAKLSKGKLYRPRVYDFKGIHGKYTQETLQPIMREALAVHPNQSKLTPEQLDLASQEITAKVLDGTFDLNFLTSSRLVPKELPFGTMLKQRKFKLDETKLGDILKTNLDDVTGAYHYKMRGRQATAFAFGTDNLQEISLDIRAKMQEEGTAHLAEDVKALERTVEDLLGTLRMNALSDTPAWTWTRNLASFNSIRLGGGFGGNQFIELASNLFASGFTHVITGRFANSFKNAGKLLYTKQKVDDQFTRAMVNSGFMSDVLHTSRVNRYADTEAGFNTGTLENGLNNLNDKLMKWNAMRYLMGAMEDMTGGAIMDQLSILGKQSKLSKTEVNRLARWGLTHQEAKSLAKDIDKYYDPKEGRFELDKFSQENQDNFQLAISRGISEAVIQGDSIHLPNWMKAPGPVLKLMSQFMRFPLIANEILLRKGMSEEQARMASAVIASAVTYMGLKYVREQASIQLGIIDEVDAKYDYFGYNGDEAIEKGLLESFNYNAPLGMMSTIFNAGAVATGNAELGRDYANSNQAEAFFGPTFGGVLPDVLAITKAAAEGDITDEKTASKIKSLAPFNNLPIVNEALKEIIKEEF